MLVFETIQYFLFHESIHLEIPLTLALNKSFLRFEHIGITFIALHFLEQVLNLLPAHFVFLVIVELLNQLLLILGRCELISSQI